MRLSLSARPAGLLRISSILIISLLLEGSALIYRINTKAFTLSHRHIPKPYVIIVIHFQTFDNITPADQVNESRPSDLSR